MSLISHALIEAKKHYDAKTYAHAMRVATYVAKNNLILEEDLDKCIALAIMHDLLEDTDYEIACFLPCDFVNSLNVLTKGKCEDYIEYIKRIRNSAHLYPLAYWVKLADMKDHLAQTETLTDKLKEKYLAALPYLL